MSQFKHYRGNEWNPEDYCKRMIRLVQNDNQARQIPEELHLLAFQAVSDAMSEQGLQFVHQDKLKANPFSLETIEGKPLKHQSSRFGRWIGRKFYEFVLRSRDSYVNSLSNDQVHTPLPASASDETGVKP
jgi:hypothetical protein